MADELRLPNLGEGVTEGEIARWLVREGDVVAVGEPIVEVQTDKATVEIPSPFTGSVLKLLVAEGELAAVGAALAVIGAAGEQLLRPVATLPDQESPAPGPIVAVVGPEPLEATRATPSEDARS